MTYDFACLIIKIITKIASRGTFAKLHPNNTLGYTLSEKARIRVRRMLKFEEKDMELRNVQRVIKKQTEQKVQGE